MRIGVQKYRPERDSRRGSADSGGQGSRWMMPPYAHLWERCNVAGALQDGVVTLHVSHHAPMCHGYCLTCLLICNKDRCMSLLCIPSGLHSYAHAQVFRRPLSILRSICPACPACPGGTKRAVPGSPSMWHTCRPMMHRYVRVRTHRHRHHRQAGRNVNRQTTSW